MMMAGKPATRREEKRWPKASRAGSGHQRSRSVGSVGMKKQNLDSSTSRRHGLVALDVGALWNTKALFFRWAVLRKCGKDRWVLPEIGSGISLTGTVADIRPVSE